MIQTMISESHFLNFIISTDCKLNVEFRIPNNRNHDAKSKCPIQNKVSASQSQVTLLIRCYIVHQAYSQTLLKDAFISPYCSMCTIIILPRDNCTPGNFKLPR